MYIIKQIPEDFIVNEIFSPEIKAEGEYVYFRLKKTNYNTIDAIKRIADALKIPVKKFGFAGAKDRKAITTQVISIQTRDQGLPARLKHLKLKDIQIEILGQSDKPVSLGDHEGNKFIATIRNLDRFPEQITSRFINYFGPQRFGEKNELIGKAIIKKEFKKAVELIDRPELDEYLEKHPNDFVGALQKLPKKIVSLFVHAYQSGIWNRIIDKVKEEELYTPGFDTEYQSKETEGLIDKELQKDGISKRDFIIRQIPNMQTGGRVRKKWVETRDFQILEKTDDDLNPAKKKMKIHFKLPKGSYATVFIESIFAIREEI